MRLLTLLTLLTRLTRLTRLTLIPLIMRGWWGWRQSVLPTAYLTVDLSLAFLLVDLARLIALAHLLAPAHLLALARPLVALALRGWRRLGWWRPPGCPRAVR